jgi:3-isopropylmalate/(R)-2-methylmalate dehydratase large subunit
VNPGPESSSVYQVDVSDLSPQVARPNSPRNAVPIDACAGQPIDYVFIGSCAGSRLSDIEEAASVLSKHRVSRKVHCVVTPGSKQIYLDALKAGFIADLVQAGAIVTPPGCGACVGTQGTIPASNDRVFSTMNRNFRGRMGNPNAEIWLGSALTAAHVAVRGLIPPQSEMT